MCCLFGFGGKKTTNSWTSLCWVYEQCSTSSQTLIFNWLQQSVYVAVQFTSSCWADLVTVNMRRLSQCSLCFLFLPWCLQLVIVLEKTGFLSESPSLKSLWDLGLFSIWETQCFLPVLWCNKYKNARKMTFPPLCKHTACVVHPNNCIRNGCISC